MNIVISSGHGLHVRGAACAATSFDEVDEARPLVDAIAHELRRNGHNAMTFHDDTSDDQDENLKAICGFHNKQTRDLDVSVHFNATPGGYGTEVYYGSDQALAARVSAAIAEAGGFRDRGAKSGSGLYFCNHTDEKALLLEICFLDSQGDTALYREHHAAIARAIALSLAGDDEELARPPEEIAERPPAHIAHPPTLQEGDEGTDVEHIQDLLGLPIDGDFGPLTDTAVAAFQAAAGLTDDGIIGPATWDELDGLERRLNAGSERLPPDMQKQICKLAADSDLQTYQWRDRGMAPLGYLPGMACGFAIAARHYIANDPTALALAAAAGDEDIDALAWYADEFAELGLANDTAGLATLRHLFALQIGLGMRESSGRYYEGRDMSADNVAADTAEAGLFQMSWNMQSAHPAMAGLLAAFWHNPHGLRPIFASGLAPDADGLEHYGEGAGAQFQWLAKYAPAFAIFTAALGLRNRRQHWGPINRREAELKIEADDLLRTVQRLAIGWQADDAAADA